MFLLVLFIFVGTASGVYYNKTYLKEDKLSRDIQKRLKKDSNNIISDYEILKQRDLKNLRIILYRYTTNSFNLVTCSIYEKTPNGRFKFIKGQNPDITMGTMMVKIKEKAKNYHYYFIHFGYTGDIDQIKYEITLGNKTLIKEYNRNESFIEPYSMENGKVEIRPIYESKVAQ